MHLKVLAQAGCKHWHGLIQTDIGTQVHFFAQSQGALETSSWPYESANELCCGCTFIHKSEHDNI